jgi:hypothetical protein
MDLDPVSGETTACPEEIVKPAGASSPRRNYLICASFTPTLIRDAARLRDNRWSASCDVAY